ncbi:MAG: hypothetical protein OXK82_06830 [Deltaproteobacteria bacterium]|nr:hypothetical protein [Deltaproteobacteria bacterium]
MITWLAVVLALFLCQAVVAAEDFYKGKNLRMLVGFSPGGGYDTYTRFVARYIRQYIPGSPTPVVQNLPGAGSLVTANFIYKKAKPDGLTLGVWSPGLVLAHAMGDKKVKIVPRRFEIIGVPTRDAVACAIMGRTGLKTLDDIVQSGRELKMGGTRAPGITTDPFLFLNRALGTRFRSITGYGGTARVRLAMDKGEVDGACWTWDSMRITARGMLDNTGDRKLIPFIIAQRRGNPEVKDLPLFQDVLTGKNLEAFKVWNLQNGITRIFTLPPGTPKDRVAILQKAFKSVTENPAFLADARRADLAVDYVSPGEIRKALVGFDTMAPDIREYLQILTGFKKLKQ